MLKLKTQFSYHGLYIAFACTLMHFDVKLREFLSKLKTRKMVATCLRGLDAGEFPCYHRRGGCHEPNGRG